MTQDNRKKIENLFLIFLELKNLSDAKRFLRDLLTEAELLEFANRWQAAQMLSEEIPYTAIQSKTGLSSRTIARISLWLNKGMGGYKLMIKRLGIHHHNSIPAGKGLY